MRSCAASVGTVLAALIIGVGLMQLAVSHRSERVWLEAPEALAPAQGSFEQAIETTLSAGRAIAARP